MELIINLSEAKEKAKDTSKNNTDKYVIKGVKGYFIIGFNFADEWETLIAHYKNGKKINAKDIL